MAKGPGHEVPQGPQNQAEQAGEAAALDAAERERAIIEGRIPPEEVLESGLEDAPEGALEGERPEEEPEVPAEEEVVEAEVVDEAGKKGDIAEEAEEAEENAPKPADAGAGGNDGGDKTPVVDLDDDADKPEKPDDDDDDDGNPSIKDLPEGQQIEILRQGQNSLKEALEASNRTISSLEAKIDELTADRDAMVEAFREEIKKDREEFVKTLQASWKEQTEAILAKMDKQQTAVAKPEKKWSRKMKAAAAAVGVIGVAAAGVVGYAIGNSAKDDTASTNANGNVPTQNAASKMHDSIFKRGNSGDTVRLTAKEKRIANLIGKDLGISNINTKEGQQAIQHILRAEDAKTVAGTAARLNANKDNVHAYITLLGSKLHSPDIVDHYSTKDAVNSMKNFEKYGGKDKNSYDYAIAVADAVASSDGNAAMYWNIMHGNPNSNQLPAGLSLDQARHDIFQRLLQDGTKFSIERPTGTWINYGQHGEDVYRANIEHTDGTQRMFVVTYANGQKMYFKLYKGAGGEDCVNFNVRAVLTFRTTNEVINRHFPPPTVNTVPPHLVMPPIHGEGHPHGHPPEQKPPEHKPPEDHHSKPKQDNKTSTGGRPGGTGGTGIPDPTRPVAELNPPNVGQEQQPLPTPVVPQDSHTTQEQPGVPTNTSTDTHEGTTAPQNGNTGTAGSVDQAPATDNQ